MEPTTGDETAVDGHVHLYPGMEAARVFDAAHRNMRHAAPGAVAFCLLLTETSRDGAFGALASGRMALGGWHTRRLPQDPAALIAADGAGRELTLIAGRQIVSVEGIEVLAPATRVRFSDGRPVAEILQALRSQGTPAILPWGLGKWLGRRGRRVAELVGHGMPGVLLGDNAGRPPAWPRPRLFDAAPVLPGTDPLPVPDSEEDVGRFGFLLPGLLDPERPATDLARRLMTLEGQPTVFGDRRGTLAVLAEQMTLRRTARR